MLVLSTGFVNDCPSNLLSNELSPPPFPSCVNKYTVSTDTVCKGGGEVWGCITASGSNCHQLLAA